jgi:hypothetical protein
MGDSSGWLFPGVKRDRAHQRLNNVKTLAFGAARYTPGDTDGLPEEAVLASLGCGNPLPVATSEKANGSWTWAPAAGSTCCSPPVGSAQPDSPTAWT